MAGQTRVFVGVVFQTEFTKCGTLGFWIGALCSVKTKDLSAQGSSDPLIVRVLYLGRGIGGNTDKVPRHVDIAHEPQARSLLGYTYLARIILFNFFIAPHGVERSEPNEPVAVKRLQTKTKNKV